MRGTPRTQVARPRRRCDPAVVTRRAPRGPRRNPAPASAPIPSAPAPARPPRTRAATTGATPPNARAWSAASKARTPRCGARARPPTRERLAARRRSPRTGGACCASRAGARGEAARYRAARRRPREQRAAAAARRPERARRPEAHRRRRSGAGTDAAPARRHDVPADRALERARHRRIRREAAGVSRAASGATGGSRRRASCTSPSSARRCRAATADGASPAAGRHPLAHAFVPIAILTLVWGCNWPVLKMGVSEIAPLTFRALTLPFAALGMLLVARASGDSIRMPREWWGRVAVLAFFNIAGWNGFVLFGVQQLPAGTQRDHRVHDADLGDADLDGRAARAAQPAQDRRPRARHARHGGAAGRRHPPHRLDADRRAADPGRGGPVGVRHRAAAQVEAADRAEHAVRLDDAAGLAAARDARAVLRAAPAVVPRAPVGRRRGSRFSTTSSWPARSRTGRGSRSRARCRWRCRRCRRCRCRWSACSRACCSWASGRARPSSSRWRW